ncbi:hypothetical protein [Nocardia sp. NPDC006630]|uniref:hypothetical protein n=1 Tax=Nocardia sp. NPDC006630 TaxID=3157181 RepID=UPI0033A4AAC4
MCSEYKFWDTILCQAEPNEAAAKPQVAQQKGDTARQLLAQVAAQPSTDTPTASAIKIKIKMLALDPAFDENRYGYRNFRESLDKVPGAKIVGRSGGDITVSLP